MKILQTIALILLASLAFNASAEQSSNGVADAFMAGATSALRGPYETASDLTDITVELLKRGFYLAIDSFKLPGKAILEHTRTVHNDYVSGKGKKYLSSLAAHEKATFAFANLAMVGIGGYALVKVPYVPPFIKVLIFGSMISSVAPAIAAYNNQKI
jgi:hypothetical protein